MSWLDFFQTPQSSCNLSFGRGINAQISPEEEELFNKSYKAFENKNILDAYDYFFQSLINYSHERSNENIIISREEETLTFEIFQGTARIVGRVTHETLYAEVKIVKKEKASVALKRYILERNYQLTYVNYFSDAEFIKLKLYQDNITLTPQKIFFPLRELALNADFDKEHIKSEFEDVTLNDIEHLQSVNQDILKTKYATLQKWITKLEEKILTLPSNDNASMQSFLHLNLLLKIDYLLVPKFKIYQKLSKKIQLYFSDENTTLESKNEELHSYILQLRELDFTAFCTNFYDAKYTFNPIEKTPYDEIVNFISESQNKIRWYKNNRYPQVISTIYAYMAFHTLYNFGINPTLRELFHLLVAIQHASFFAEIGCEVYYNETDETFSKKLILSKLKNISEKAQKKYKSFEIISEELNFTSIDKFCHSYYTMLKNLNFEEI